MELPKELTDQLYTVEDALTQCFGGYRRGPDGDLFVDCCGKVTYGSGIMGPDIAECQACHRAVVNVLSPHVSPLLIRDSTVCLPSDEFIDAVGIKCWMACPPKPAAQAPGAYCV